MCVSPQPVRREGANENSAVAAAATQTPQDAEAFEDKLVGILNGGALALMISIGHRTGLFDTLAASPAVDSATLAEKAGLQERYVREWLGAMTVGGIVEHDHESGKYRLPAEHAASLTRANAAGNMGVFAQYIGVLGSVEDDIVDCFRNGGGVPYERYKRFHEVMAEDSGQSVLPADSSSASKRVFACSTSAAAAARRST